MPSRTTRSPRLWIDFECGATHGSTDASIEFFNDYQALFGQFREAWLFCSDEAPLARGFYFPAVSHTRYAVPASARGPHCVLIDEHDDQLWIDGVSCGDGSERATAAATILRAAGFALPRGRDSRDSESLFGYDEMHFMNGGLVSFRLTTERTPVSPAGKTMVANRRLVNRLEFDNGPTTAADLWDLWTRATEPGAWLGRPTQLTLFESKRMSEAARYQGCQLIAAGESGRELWLLLPEPDQYDSMSALPRKHYAGSYVEYEAVTREIFRTVGVELDPPDDRPLWRRLLGQHTPPPQVITWP